MENFTITSTTKDKSDDDIVAISYRNGDGWMRVAFRNKNSKDFIVAGYASTIYLSVAKDHKDYKAYYKGDSITISF